MHFGRLTLIGAGIVLAVVLLGGSILPTSMVSQKNTGFTLQTSNAVETHVSPKISTASVRDVMAKSTTSISLPTITGNLVLPFNQAFAITSTQLSVSSSEWTVPRQPVALLVLQPTLPVMFTLQRILVTK